MKLNEIIENNNLLNEMYESDELEIQDYEENRQAIIEILQNKAEQIIFKNNEVKSSIEQAKELAKLYSDKAKQLEKQQEQFNEYLMYCMNQMELEEIKTPIGKIKIKTTTRTEVDEESLPNEAFDFIRKRKSIKEIEALGITLNKIQNKTLEVK